MNQRLWNFQCHDLLKHREIGEVGYKEFVRTKLPAPMYHTRKNNCVHFLCLKQRKKRIKQIERERKVTQRFLKRQLSRPATNGGHVNTEMIFGPISVLPKALVDSHGLPYKASKSNPTSFLKNQVQRLACCS